MCYENIVREFERNGVDFYESPKPLIRAACAFANDMPNEFGDFLENYLLELQEEEDTQKGFEMLAEEC